MQSRKFAKRVFPGVKTLSLVLASAFLISSGADAAGLGKLTVLSALGQPLRAEIELTSVTDDEVGNLVPKLANPDAYQQANIDFNNALPLLRFNIENRGSRHFVLITSKPSINEPFLEILVELTSGNGRLIREYALLLDPVGTNSGYAATNVENDEPASNINKPDSAYSTYIQDKPVRQVNYQITAKSDSGTTQNDSSVADKNSAYHQVKRGDTLTKIARQYQYRGISLEQMLVAIQRSNPAAFIHDNINLIRSGNMLVIPDASEVKRISESEAKKIVHAQSVDFDAYRHQLAEQAVHMPPAMREETKKINSGKITAKVTETPTPVNEAEDKLELSKAHVQEKSEVKTSDEDKIAKHKALEAANARIKELEQNTANLKKVLELQKGNSPESSPSPMTKEGSASATSSAALPTIETDAATSLARQSTQPAETKPESKLSYFRSYFRSYFIYGGVVALTLLVMAWLYFRQRKQTTRHGDDKAGFADSILSTPASPDSETSQQAQLQQDELQHSDVVLTPVPPANHPDMNEIDPVEEANAYIAFGHDEQAEEILKETLRIQPARNPVRMKLLEIYARRNDRLSFEAMAREIDESTGGNGADWAQTASMGMAIDPNNPLYAHNQHAQEINATSANPDSTDAVHVPMEFDLSGIDLELPKLDPEVHENNSTDMTTSPASFSEDVELILDLAIACKKNGDRDGALELLKDVIRNGNQEQVERAKVLLNELA